jgi:hypothetical protein
MSTLRVELTAHTNNDHHMKSSSTYTDFDWVRYSHVVMKEVVIAMVKDALHTAEKRDETFNELNIKIEVQE